MKKRANAETQESASSLELLMTGVDIENRIIEISSDVTEGMVSVVRRSLLTMSRISHEPITIHFSSGGGSVYSGLAIYDCIRACPCDVHIVASGEIMSMGFIIFLAGDVRVALPHTTFMMHSLSYSPGETPKIVRNHEVDVLEGKRMNNILMDIMSQRTKQPKKWWYRKILTQDFYMNLDEAKQFGVLYTPTPKKIVKRTRNAKKVQSRR